MAALLSGVSRRRGFLFNDRFIPFVIERLAIQMVAYAARNTVVGRLGQVVDAPPSPM
jgi:hypothetical protein